MALCGLVWPCVVLCGLVWPCVALCVHAWSCVVPYGLMWPRPYTYTYNLLLSCVTFVALLFVILWLYIALSRGYRSKFIRDSLEIFLEILAK